MISERLHRSKRGVGVQNLKHKSWNPPAALEEELRAHATGENVEAVEAKLSLSKIGCLIRFYISMRH
jgi:hypothetical protein